MSLFIAIRLPEFLQERIDSTFKDAEISEELWQRKDNLHITLLFLNSGMPGNEYLESVKKRMRAYSFESFTLKITGTNIWKLKENRQVFHLQMAESRELTSIQSGIVSLFPEIKQSKYGFTPHISLIRSSEIPQSKIEELKYKFRDFSTDEFIINEIHLYVGEKDPENKKRNRYRILESFMANSNYSV